MVVAWILRYPEGLTFFSSEDCISKIFFKFYHTRLHKYGTQDLNTQYSPVQSTILQLCAYT